jgi:hypothetical protein
VEEYYHRIQQQYQKSAGDSKALFQTLLSVADETGLDEALACLERCVSEKRLAWLNANLARLDKTGDPVFDGYRLFYEAYLGVSVPENGEIVEQTGQKMVTRWWNHCPTLEACLELGLDTREICKRVYHKPVQAFLAQIDPRLRFDRNYAAIRPYRPYCEEIISLAEENERPGP